MTDKFEEFMKKNVPEANGGLRTLELPARSQSWKGIGVSIALAASVVLVTVNRQPVAEDTYFDEFTVSFDDEFPEDIQVAEMIFDEI